MPQIAVKLSSSSFSRLKRLAWQGETTYANIIESALATYQPETSQLAPTIPDDLQSAIDVALAPVLSRLAAIEAMQSGTPQNRPESPFEAQPIAEPTLDANAAVEGAAGVKDAGMELGSEPNKRPHPHPAQDVHEFVASLIAGGERSPMEIAEKINARGYRTKNGTEYVRSSTVITNPLKELRG